MIDDSENAILKAAFKLQSSRGLKTAVKTVNRTLDIE